MRILVVEDEKKLAAALQRGLELQTYAVDVAHDGVTGYDLAATTEYDLIILDIMLPEMDGLRVCSNLRAEKIATPILLLTAKGSVADRVTGLDSGADDYLIKPFAFEELFSRIRALTRRSQNITETTLSVADLAVDLHALTVTRGGRLLHLSSKEFAILEYLLRNKHTVVSKEKIVEHVWDYAADILPSTVEVHIKNLRDKVDKPFSTALIHTVRGFGYQIRENL